MKIRSILHIDDDAEDQEIFSSALEKVSDALKYVSFTNARDALARLINNEFNPDVIFLDLNMPTMSGPEFLQEIKSVDHLRSIPVIILSTTSNPATIASTKLMGAVDFITKPNRFDELVEILRPIIQKDP
ncbi:MAG: response regulator [Chryseolinea sp.]